MVQLALAGYQSRIRIYYEDTDSGGVVYHANYLKFMERARTDWLYEFGFAPKDINDQEGVLFVVKSTHLEFFKPARLGDQLVVSVELDALNPASLHVTQHITRDSDKIVRGRLHLACVDISNFKICRVPTEIMARFT